MPTMFNQEMLDAIAPAILEAFGDNGLEVKVGKGDSAIVVTFESLPAASIAHAVRRGLQEDLNNAKAGLGDDPTKARERIDAVAEKYRTADFSRATGERGPSDSVETVARQIMAEDLATRVAKAKKANPGYKLDKEGRADALKALWDNGEATYRKSAEKRIAERKALSESLLNKAGSDVLSALGIGPAESA